MLECSCCDTTCAYEYTTCWFCDRIFFHNRNDLFHVRFQCCPQHSNWVFNHFHLLIRLLTKPSVPIYELWRQATSSIPAVTIFMLMLISCAIFGQNGCQQTASRLTWSFARDYGMLLSNQLSKIHPVLKVPVNALIFNAVVVFLMGCVYLGSSTAFNALISTGLILQHISFAFPAALLLYRRRSSHYLPQGRSFNLYWFGWIANVVTVLIGVLVVVFYNFPLTLPVSGSSMSKFFGFDI